MAAGRSAWPERLLFGLALGLLVAGNARGVLAPATYEPRPRSDEVLRVVTWNVGGGMAQGGSALRAEHVDHVVATLVALDVDLVVLQEVAGGAQLEHLRRALGAGWQALGSGGRGSDRRVALLARTGELRPFDVNAPEGSAQRVLGAAWQTVAGQAVVAVGVHASAFSPGDRNREIGAAAAALHAAGERRPGALRILAGDLNLDLDLDKRRDLFTRDAHRDVETYNFVGRDLVDAARGRGATAEPDRRLDYIFLGPPTFAARAAGPWKGRRVGDMDHDPVVADLIRR